MKLFKTCMAAAIACSLFYSTSLCFQQEEQACSSGKQASLLSDTYVVPDTLQSIIEPDCKNTLILCTDGSGLLYDSIFIIAHNSTENTIKAVSLPRDLYVPYGTEIQAQMDQLGLSNEKGIYKLNIAGYIGEKIKYPATVFEDGDVSFMADLLKEMTGITVSDYAIVNFQTFETFIDALGGITLTIPCDIRNAQGELLLAQGLQKLTGQEALLYARTRKFYDAAGNLLPSGGDFTRKEHQLSMIREIIPQLVQKTGLTKLPNLVQTLRKEVRHSFTLSDLYRGYKLLRELTAENITLETHSITGPEIRPTDDGCLYIEFK